MPIPNWSIILNQLAIRFETDSRSGHQGCLHKMLVIIMRASSCSLRFQFDALAQGAPQEHMAAVIKLLDSTTF
jgi:hypothetical protein